VEQRKEAVQEQVVFDGAIGVVRPDAGAFHHVAGFDGRGGFVVRGGFGVAVGAGGLGELGFEVVGVGLGVVST
jgi:hypothetical protein